jgi:hypothetical protein
MLILLPLNRRQTCKLGFSSRRHGTNLFSTITTSRRDGEIGRRSGLKIRRAQKACGGSIPPPGTNLRRLVRPSKWSGAIAYGIRNRG